MDRDLAFDILDEWVAKDKTGCVIEALRFIRKDLAEALKPSHNSIKAEILPLLEHALFVSTDCKCVNDSRSCIEEAAAKLSAV